LPGHDDVIKFAEVRVVFVEAFGYFKIGTIWGRVSTIAIKGIEFFKHIFKRI